MEMKKILIIEDDKHIRESMCELLTLESYAVDCAENGREGLIKALKNLPDIVICDVLMPVFNGWQTLSVFRGTNKLQCIPFIFLTAKTTMEDLRKGMNLGADDYLTKPFSPTELISIIKMRLKIVDRIKSYEKLKNKRNVESAVENFRSKEKDKNDNFCQSLERAKAVQNVILPNYEKINGLFKDYFSYYVPKDTISGDFFWIREVDDEILVGVIDCTGHGVPAALLTMICYTQLNIAVDRFNLTSPAQIINKVNDLIVDFMGVNDNNLTSDGMDIAICTLNYKNKTIKYAGAKRPLYFVSNKLETIQINKDRLKVIENNKGDKLFEFRGDRLSVGANVSNFYTREQHFKFDDGDKVYLSTDGLVDQYGGEHFKRFKSRHLKELLLSLKNESMDSQNQIIHQTLSKWKGDNEQTDDMAIFGIKL